MDKERDCSFQQVEMARFGRYVCYQVKREGRETNRGTAINLFFQAVFTEETRTQ